MFIIYLFKNPFNKLKDINTPTFLLEKGKKKEDQEHDTLSELLHFVILAITN